MNRAQVGEKQAVIVCAHIASREYPILYGERGEPLDDVDSGWQFLCYTGIDEDTTKAQVWSIKELLNIEPTLAPFIESSVGTRLFREDGISPWKFCIARST